jgi:N6-adenosine-specific RNA methylase IME4
MKKYSIIYADPPWSYDDKALNRGGAERHYTTMTVEDICHLPVAEMAAENCVLFLWGTWPKLHESLRVVEAWGFEYKTCAFVWVKTNKRTNTNQGALFPQDNFDSFWGMGRWTRANSEFCLLAVKGKPGRESAGVHQIIYAPIAKHSKKPQEARDKIIQLCGDLPRVELFARMVPPGWEVWGNEVDTEISMAI